MSARKAVSGFPEHYPAFISNRQNQTIRRLPHVHNFILLPEFFSYEGRAESLSQDFLIIRDPLRSPLIIVV